jgi:hypothetical protein
VDVTDIVYKGMFANSSELMRFYCVDGVLGDFHFLFDLTIKGKAYGDVRFTVYHLNGRYMIGTTAAQRDKQKRNLISACGWTSAQLQRCVYKKRWENACKSALYVLIDPLVQIVQEYVEEDIGYGNVRSLIKY